MANFLRIKSSFERHVNRDLVTEARCHDSGDEFVVEYYFDNGNMASSRHATEAEAMAELLTFLRGPRPRPETSERQELVKVVVCESQDVRGQVVREVDGWKQIEIVVPLPDDGIYLVAYLQMDGVKLLEWTTTAPDCFQAPEIPSPELPQSSGSETCQQAGSCQGTCQQQSGPVVRAMSELSAAVKSDPQLAPQVATSGAGERRTRKRA